MEYKEIIVTVTGAWGSGKTGVSLEIVKALRNIGFEVEWDIGIDYKSEADIVKNQTERLVGLKSKISKIVLNEQQWTRKEYNKLRDNQKS